MTQLMFYEIVRNAEGTMAALINPQQTGVVSLLQVVMDRGKVVEYYEAQVAISGDERERMLSMDGGSIDSPFHALESAKYVLRADGTLFELTGQLTELENRVMSSDVYKSLDKGAQTRVQKVLDRGYNQAEPLSLLNPRIPFMPYEVKLYGNHITSTIYGQPEYAVHNARIDVTGGRRGTSEQMEHLFRFWGLPQAHFINSPGRN